jgi:lipopolysaccharide/colanic/teichoic acid biosynthesis glycosyltransferase
MEEMTAVAESAFGLSATVMADDFGADSNVFVGTPLPEHRTRYFAKKYRLERAIAAVLLIPAAPVVGLLVLLIRVTSKGPGIFRQMRIGLHGQPFQVYKLRSMRVDAESDGKPRWSTKSDPRVTGIGKMLRKLHLDELPQLWNVVRGDMALVGPRPERPEFVKVLKQAIPGYEDRLTVLPGITGLAQINLPPDVDLTSVRRKQDLDIRYIHESTISLDLRIIAATGLRIVGFRGDRVNKLMRLKRRPSVANRGSVEHASYVNPPTLDQVEGEVSSEIFATQCVLPVTRPKPDSLPIHSGSKRCDSPAAKASDRQAAELSVFQVKAKPR